MGLLERQVRINVVAVQRVSLVVYGRGGLPLDLLQVDGVGGDGGVGQVGHLASTCPLQQLGGEPARQLVAGRR